MAQEMDIAPRTMSRITKQGLGFRVFKQQTRQWLKKKNQDAYCRCMVKCYKEIPFTDEKKFYYGENFQLSK